ncbi:MAG: alpha/beta hydrolase [Bryobacteraceae bacterium]
MRYLLWLLVAAAFAGVAGKYLAYLATYHPMRYPEGCWEPGGEDVWLRAADGVRLHAWWIPAGGRLATLFLHGNAGNITHRAGHAAEIAASGSAVLLLDYRGYGRSEGRPSESGLYSDADAAYDYLAARGYRIVLHGESLGTAVAVELASRRPCAGLILEAPFPSAGSLAATVLPVLGPLLAPGYDSRSRIGRVRAPLLVIHGDRDDIVPYRLGRALFEIAPEPKRFFTAEGCGHNDIPRAPGYGAALRSFYALVSGSQAPQP